MLVALLGAACAVVQREAYAPAVGIQPLHVAPRAPVPHLAVIADSAAEQAKKTLLAEVVKDQRSMDTVRAAVATLAGAPRPKKLKRALVGDWKLTFVSDEAALAPFVFSAAASSKFAKLEDVYLRLQQDAVQFIEVVRSFGPWGGNAASALHGKWSADQDCLSWRNAYMITDKGREVDPPTAGEVRVTAAHVSEDVLILRLRAGLVPSAPVDPWQAVQDPSTGGTYWWNTQTNQTTAVGAPPPAGPEAADASFAVFTKLKKSALKSEMEAFNLKVDILGP
jgi:hypothetical protein